VIAVPLTLSLLVIFHLVALRSVGSNNPDGIEIKDRAGSDGKPLDGIPFHPYYIVKDLLSVALFLAVFATVVFFIPTFGGLFLEADNFDPANVASTPEHIAPVWYFTPFYAILRAVPDQRLGALLMVLAVASFAISFVALGYLGLQAASGRYIVLARLFTVVYFAYFWLMPIYSKLEAASEVPQRVQ
jgi:ubiquinol-cytochrome c reductase cytochrome b subunit